MKASQAGFEQLTRAVKARAEAMAATSDAEPAEKLGRMA